MGWRLRSSDAAAFVVVVVVVIAFALALFVDKAVFGRLIRLLVWLRVIGGSVFARVCAFCCCCVAFRFVVSCVAFVGPPIVFAVSGWFGCPQLQLSRAVFIVSVACLRAVFVGRPLFSLSVVGLVARSCSARAVFIVSVRCLLACFAGRRGLQRRRACHGAGASTPSLAMPSQPPLHPCCCAGQCMRMFHPCCCAAGHRAGHARACHIDCGQPCDCRAFICMFDPCRCAAGHRAGQCTCTPH